MQSSGVPRFCALMLLSAEWQLFQCGKCRGAQMKIFQRSDQGFDRTRVAATARSVGFIHGDHVTTHNGAQRGSPIHAVNARVVSAAKPNVIQVNLRRMMWVRIALSA